jgi:hypothetical protein
MGVNGNPGLRVTAVIGTRPGRQSWILINQAAKQKPRIWRGF